MAAIELTDIDLRFTLRKATRLSLKEYVLNGMFLNRLNPKLSVQALRGLNLAVKDGDRVGVIGHNGAGKSTLLKLIAGVYPPTRGQMRVEGRICSLFDITLGFEPDATGRENIAFRAYLQGETPKTLQSKLDDVEQFCELGQFLDTPVRYYSAGMSIRLAFSIATVSEPEILLIDEVLSVGDMAFQLKAQRRMRNLMASASLMVMVSHDLSSVQAMCNKAIWLEKGQIVMSGSAAEVVAAYQHSAAVPVAA